jgi:hypothetical protein
MKRRSSPTNSCPKYRIRAIVDVLYFLTFTHRLGVLPSTSFTYTNFYLTILKEDESSNVHFTISTFMLILDVKSTAIVIYCILRFFLYIIIHVRIYSLNTSSSCIVIFLSTFLNRNHDSDVIELLVR